MINEDSERRQITQAKRCIHTTCECSDRYIALIIADSGISIHAAREGGDYAAPVCIGLATSFQSTPPVKAATQLDERKRNNYAISIHAAREGGDKLAVRCDRKKAHFNPRRP